MSEPKSAPVARRVAAREAAAAAPIPAATMLAEGNTITLAGKPVTVYPIALADKPALDAALMVLGDDYLMPALAEDNPEGLSRVIQVTTPGAPDLTAEDIRTALRTMQAGIGTAAVNAMLDVLELALNPIDHGACTPELLDRLAAWQAGDDAVGERPIVPRLKFVGRGEIAVRFAVRDFPAILRRVMDASGLNP